MKEILKRHGIKPSKKLGQNFLIDKDVLKKIIEAANLSVNDIVLEIGPGLGILTIELAKRVKKVIAVEKDKKMCEILQETLNTRNVGNVRIINQDILKISDVQLCRDRDKVGHNKLNYKLVANLPYYITSPVIRKFLEIEHKPELMVLMVQKEVAQRICTRTQKGFRGKMSILSVSVQFYAKPEIISFVSKKSFYPKPKVDSAIIKIAPKPIPEIDTKKFFDLIKRGFSSKRKMLKNNLSKKLKVKSQKLKVIFKQLNINPKTRAENLSIQDWLKLFHRINFS